MVWSAATRYKIYTKTGDLGSSSLYNGARLSKDEEFCDRRRQPPPPAHPKNSPVPVAFSVFFFSLSESLEGAYKGDLMSSFDQAEPDPASTLGGVREGEVEPSHPWVLTGICGCFFVLPRPLSTHTATLCVVRAASWAGTLSPCYLRPSHLPPLSQPSPPSLSSLPLPFFSLPPLLCSETAVAWAGPYARYDSSLLLGAPLPAGALGGCAHAPSPAARRVQAC